MKTKLYAPNPAAAARHWRIASIAGIIRLNVGFAEPISCLSHQKKTIINAHHAANQHQPIADAGISGARQRVRCMHSLEEPNRKGTLAC